MAGLQGTSGVNLSSGNRARHGERRKVAQPPMPKFSSSSVAVDEPSRSDSTFSGSMNQKITGASGALFRVPGGASAVPAPSASHMAKVHYVDPDLGFNDEYDLHGSMHSHGGIGVDGAYDHEQEYEWDNEGFSTLSAKGGADGYPESSKAAPIQVLAKQISESANREVDRRIVRVDNGVLDQPRYVERLREVMEFARALIYQLGVKNVIELLIHAHAKVVYNRHGRRALDGYVLRCYGSAPASVLSEVDFGHHSVVVALNPESVKNMDQTQLAGMADALLDAAGGKSGASSSARALFYDEGLLPSNITHKPTSASRRDESTRGSKRIPSVFVSSRDVETAAVESSSSSSSSGSSGDVGRASSTPTLSYNGEVMFLEGFTPGEGNTYQILVQSHCTKSVQIMHDRVLALDLNVNELYRSMAYDTCIVHSARSCVKIARAAAQAMGLEVAASSGSSTDLSDSKDSLSRVRVDACAPLTFIAAVPQHDASGRAVAPSFIVHVNTFGEYDLVRPVTPGTPPPSAQRASATDAAKRKAARLSSNWRAFPVLNSSIGGCTIMRQVGPPVAPMRPYWLDASVEQCTRAARETREQLRAIPASVLNYEPYDITGYPTRGVYDEQAELRDPTDLAQSVTLVGVGKTRPCIVVYHSYQQPFQNSKHYAPLVPVSQDGPLYELWSKGYPQGPGQPRRFVAANTSDALIKYSGGLHGACITLDLALQIKSSLDYLRVPPVNRAMYLEVMQLALQFYGLCVAQGRSASEVVRSDVRSMSVLLREGPGRQPFLDNLAGGAVQCDPRDQVTLLIDTQWLTHCLKTLRLSTSADCFE